MKRALGADEQRPVPPFARVTEAPLEWPQPPPEGEQPFQQKLSEAFAEESKLPERPLRGRPDETVLQLELQETRKRALQAQERRERKLELRFARPSPPRKPLPLERVLHQTSHVFVLADA